MNTNQAALPDTLPPHILEGMADAVIYADREGMVRV